jgi:hypothetical protein
MNADGLESDHPHSISELKIPKPLLVPLDINKNPLKRRRKFYFLGAWQYRITQGRASKINHSVRESVIHQAVHVFLSDTVINVPGGSNSKGHFANLVALVQSSPPSEALPFALEAVALASLGNRICNSEIKLEAMRQYTISIHRLRKANLNSKSDMFSVIACILLLGLYEVRS